MFGIGIPELIIIIICLSIFVGIFKAIKLFLSKQCQNAKIGSFKSNNKVSKHALSEQLLDATWNGDYNLVKQLLDDGADVNAVDSQSGKTAFIFAVEIGNENIAKLLLSNGANIDAKDINGNSALMFLSMSQISLVNCLIEAGAKINYQNKFGLSPLNKYKEDKTRQDIYEVLLSASTPNKSNNLTTPIYDEINTKDSNGRTQLMNSSIDCQTSKVKELLNNGADINMQCNDGLTALMYAAGNGCGDIVEMLIEKNSDVNITNNFGESAIFYASSNGYKDIVELLIKAGAKTDVVNSENQFPVMLADYNNHKEIVELLSIKKSLLDTILSNVPNEVKHQITKPFETVICNFEFAVPVTISKIDQYMEKGKKKGFLLWGNKNSNSPLIYGAGLINETILSNTISWINTIHSKADIALIHFIENNVEKTIELT